MGAILIRGARQLLTLRGPGGPRCGAALGELGILHDGALLIRDGVIAEAGPLTRIENLAAARDAFEINAAGCVVMPGFVDCHTHLMFPTAEGPAADGADAVRFVRATSGSRLKVRALAWIETMARHGTTTAEVKTGCCADEAAETKLLKTVAVLNREPLDLVPTFLFRAAAGAVEQELTAAVERTIRVILPYIRKRRLAAFADLEWRVGPDGVAQLARYLEAARGMGFQLKLHVPGPSARAAVIAAVERLAASIDHLDHASAAEAALLAGSCTMAVLLPGANLHAGGARPPARALVDSGAAIALGSNFNPRHHPMPSMQAAVALACVRMALTPAEAIAAATVNAAHALGLGARIGSLEPGKQADIAILGVPDYRELARSLGTNLVRVTIKRGECIYKEGEVARPKPAPQWPPATKPRESGLRPFRGRI